MFIADMITAVSVYRLTLLVLTILVLLTLASQFGQFLFLELTTHFRLQYVIASVACAVVLTLLQSWKFLPFAILCAILNAVYLGPYLTSNASDQPKPNGIHLRLLHANVLETNTNYADVLNVVKENNPDVVVLQEVTEEWSEGVKELRAHFPHSAIESRLHGGMAIFSRYPFDNLQTLNLDETTHVAIFVKVNLGQRSMTLLSMHPTTPITPTKFKNRNRQFTEAAGLMRKTDGPKVLIGDLNITMWSPYFKTLIQNSGLRDSRIGFGLKTSWPMPLPSFLRLPIDHCLVSSDVHVDQLKIGDTTGSDHRPIIVDLTF